VVLRLAVAEKLAPRAYRAPDSYQFIFKRWVLSLNLYTPESLSYSCQFSSYLKVIDRSNLASTENRLQNHFESQSQCAVIKFLKSPPRVCCITKKNYVFPYTISSLPQPVAVSEWSPRDCSTLTSLYPNPIPRSVKATPKSNVRKSTHRNQSKQKGGTPLLQTSQSNA
jgi:hypothetical protein